MNRRIIGIDPGTGILGFGVIDVERGKTKLVDAGVVRTKPKQPLEDSLLEIHDSLKEIIEATKPQEMAIEQLFFARNVTTAMGVAHARGVAILVGKQSGLKIAEYTPMQIKQALTGYGRATKQQIQEMVKISLRLKEVPKPDDCADALAVAIMHSQSVR